jgi:DNA primase
LQDRGLTAQTIQKFGLGYAPEGWHSLSEYLVKKGFNTSELVAAGVAIADEQNVKKVHDKFRDRIIFPFFNDKGDIIGFTGRALSKENEPKYLNSPETILFHKSSFIYGFYQAKESIRQSSIVYIVEGQVDCLQAVQSGYANTVAVSGTAFTMQHLEILRRVAGQLIFVFDGDNAGKNAALRIMPEILQQDIPSNFVLLPADQDPDSLLRHTPDQYKELLAKSLDWMTYIEQANFANSSLKEANTSKQFIELCLPLIKSLKKPRDQEEALTKLAIITSKSPHMLHKALQKTKAERKQNTTPEASASITDNVLYTLAFYCQFHQFSSDSDDIYTGVHGTVTLPDFDSSNGEKMYIVVHDTGAYQDPLAAHHCMLSSPLKLIVENGHIVVARKRESPDDVGKDFGW